LLGFLQASRIGAQHSACSTSITMNTSAEFFEWIIHAEGDPSKVESLHQLDPDDENDPSARHQLPSLASCSDCSSLDDTLSLCTSTSECSTVGTCKSSRTQRVKRRVSFSSVEVREYSVTVGDHPLCYDGLPLSLDWEHCEEPSVRSIEESRERDSQYRPPRRLSFDERRDRLFSVNSYSDETERGAELNMMIKMLQNAWSMNTILAPPSLYDIEEEDEDEDYLLMRNYRKSLRNMKNKKNGAPKEPEVIGWYRN